MQDFETAIDAARFEAKMIETMRRDGAWSFAFTQWNEIQKSSGLPEEARRRIDLEICFYRVFVAEGAASRPQENQGQFR